jgi:glycosyltransferase involved in cell wall biosynthesis
MRIGIEAQRLFRTQKHGMDVVALELIKNLIRMDQKNEYVVFVHPDKDVCIEATPNLKIRELGSPVYPIWEQIQLPTAVQEEKIDLLHCTSNTAPLRLHVPLVLTLHDIIYLEPERPGWKKMTRYQQAGYRYRKWVVPRIVNKSHKIITVSNFERQRIADFLHLPCDQLVAIHNGVGEIFKPVAAPAPLAAVRQRYHLPQNYILFLGNTDPKKNVRNVLLGYQHYFHMVKNPLPIVIIDYRQEHLDQLLALMKNQEIGQHIVLPGYISQKDLPAVYSMAAVFLYPSLRESFGLPILEAMACGTPVITSNCSSMPEVAGPAAGLVDPTVPEDIGDCLHRLLEDAGFRQQLIQKGFERAGHFSWQHMARQVLDVYVQTYRETLSERKN